MEQSLVCHYSPKGGIDDRIAAVLNKNNSGESYTKEDIGALRGIYDQETGTSLIDFGDRTDKEISDVEVSQAAVKLAEYQGKMAENHLKNLKNSTYHMAKAFLGLYKVDGWDANTRRNRINAIAMMFSEEVSRRVKAAEKNGTPITREQVVNGYKSGGKYYDGQFSIFEAVFDRLYKTYKNDLADFAQFEDWTEEELNEDPEARKYYDEEKHRIEEYRKMLANWAPLCAFARMTLKGIESLKLGNTLEYAAPTTSDDFSIDGAEEDVFSSFDAEEKDAMREAWQRLVTELSSYGSMGTEVRRFLSTIFEKHYDEDGNFVEVDDDLGFHIKMNPVALHQYLAEILRGTTLESRMIKTLRKHAETDSTVRSVYLALGDAIGIDINKPISDTNRPTYPTLLTQLVRDLHKNFVQFSALKRAKTEGRNVYARILNRETNPLHDEYILRLEMGGYLPNAVPVYKKQDGFKATRVNWEQLADWFISSRAMLPSAQDKENSEEQDVFASRKKYEEFYKLNPKNKIQYLISTSTALGLPMDEKVAERLINNHRKLNNYLVTLEKFRTQAFSLGDLSSGSVYNKAFGTIVRLMNKEAKEGTLTDEERADYRKSLDLLNSDDAPTFQSLLEGKPNKPEYRKSPGFGMERMGELLDIIASLSIKLNVERRVPWYDRKGKINSRYSDLTPSYMGDLIDKIREFVSLDADDADYGKNFEDFKNFLMDKWGQSSFFFSKERGEFLNKWLQDFLETAERKKLNINDLANEFNFVEFLGSDIDGRVSLFENFTEKQHAQAMIKQFVADRFGNKKKPFAKYPSFILGDSGVQRFFTAKRYDKKTILKGLEDVLLQERERIKYVKALDNAIKIDFAKKAGLNFDNDVKKGVTVYDSQGKVLSDEQLRALGYRPVDNFSMTATEFTQLPFLNVEFADGKYWKMITGETEIPATRKEMIDKVLEAIGTDAVRKTIEAYMQDALENFKKKLVSVGILAYNKETGKYTDADGYFTEDTRKIYENDLDAFIEDFYYNTKYATIQQIQLFTVDPAFYDHRYPIKDLQKRYKEIYAPGSGLSLEAMDSNGQRYLTKNEESAVYFDDISLSSEDVNPMFWKVLKETFKDRPDILNLYKKNTLTDGQGFRTLSSYRAVMGASGQWTTRMEAAYNRIQEIRKNAKEKGETLTEDQISDLARLATILQPIKPYLFTLEKVAINGTDSALIPVQHKYAEVVLIPELMADGKLKGIALWMENHTDEKGNPDPIDLVCSSKCVKVGNFGAADIKNSNTAESLNGSLSKAWIHRLSWADYRIQSGVPEHLNHAQLFGTQPRKLILENIDKKSDKYQQYLRDIFGVKIEDGEPTIALPGPKGTEKVKLTGKNLIALYNSLIVGNMFDSFEDFEKATNTNQSLSDKLLQNIIANNNQTEDNAFAFSIIEDGGEFSGEFAIPLGEPGLEHDATALLSSLFKKLVNKQKIKGGSAVQASALGLSGVENAGDLFEVVDPEGKDNVLYDEIELTFNVSYTSAIGGKVDLKFEDWCNSDGTLKLADGKDGRPLKIVKGREAREYLSWPVSGRDKHGQPINKDEDGYDKDGYYVPMLEVAYPGALDIVAYRIPTEKEYSMINAKVFRFSNPLAGGTMKVPSSRTTTAGFDFDIDKLYFFMREFVQNPLTDEDKYNIWTDIYKSHRDWFEALIAARQREGEASDFLSDFDKIFHNSSLAASIAEANKKTGLGKLYTYWEQAGLEGTPQEAFTAYLESHRDKYPNLFDTYSPEVSPMNPVLGKDGEVIIPGNSRAARNNLLLDLFKHRLRDKETLKSRYTPGGFYGNSEAALRMRVLQYGDIKSITDKNGKVDWSKIEEYANKIKDDKDPTKDPEPEYDFSDPTAILVYNQQNQIAAKLIGIFANQNTNHVYSSILQEMRLNNPILFGNHVEEGGGLDNFITGPEGIDIGVNVAEYLAASVDAVKDPVLNFLNLNTITADAGAMLARIGYTPMEIGLLFSQPVIKELCVYAANEGVQVDAAISRMVSKYGNQNLKLDDVFYNPSNADTNTLLDNILQYRKIEENGGDMSGHFKQGQLQILKLFNEILKDSKDLSSFIQATRFTAANSIGATWGDFYEKEMRVAQFVEKYGTQSGDNAPRIKFKLFDDETASMIGNLSPEESAMFSSSSGILNNNEGLIDVPASRYAQMMAYNPMAFEQCMYDLYRKAFKRQLKKFFPFETSLYKGMREFMAGLTKNGTLNADTINSLHRDFILYLLSRNKGSNFDGEAMNTTFKNAPMTNREYYTKAFPLIMLGIVNRNKQSSIPFFNMLQITGETDISGKNGLQITIPGIGGLQSEASSNITEAWAQAYNSEELVDAGSGLVFPAKKLAEDFYFYNFYKLGYNFHPKSAMHLAPTLLKMGLKVGMDDTYVDFMRNLIDNDNPDNTSKISMDDSEYGFFAKQYILNHLDNYAFTYNVKGEARDKIIGDVFKSNGGGWQKNFTLNLSRLPENVKSLFIQSRTKDTISFKPVLAIEYNGVTEYYMASSNTHSSFNTVSSTADGITYVQVRPQGGKGDRTQYFDKTGYSMYQNRSYMFFNMGDIIRRTAKENAAESKEELPVTTEDYGSVYDSSLQEEVEVEPLDFTNDNVLSNIDDALWERLYEASKSHFEIEGVDTWEKLKQYMLNPESGFRSWTARDLSFIYQKLKRGEKFKTIGDNGEKIDVC